MPSLLTYDNALLTANRLDDGTATASGALYTQQGNLVPESLRSVDRTDYLKVDNPERIQRPAAVVGKYKHDGYDTYLDEGILGGHVLVGWGHIITETLSTAWASPDLPDVPLVLIPWGRLWVSALPRMRETLTLAGWDDRRLILTSGDTVLGRAHVPERLIRVGELMDEGASIDPAMNDVYDRMVTRSQAAARLESKMFLPRPEGHRRAHPNEIAVEQALIDDGFTSVRGWDLTVEEQVAAAASASVLVAFSGSNLHNSVFAKRGIPVVEIRDSRAEHDLLSGVTRLQPALCALRGQPFTEVAGFAGVGNPRSTADLVLDVKRAIA